DRRCGHMELRRQGGDKVFSARLPALLRDLGYEFIDDGGVLCQSPLFQAEVTQVSSAEARIVGEAVGQAVDVELFPDLGGDLFPVHGAAADLEHDLRFVSQVARPGGEVFIQESKLAEAQNPPPMKFSLDAKPHERLTGLSGFNGPAPRECPNNLSRLSDNLLGRGSDEEVPNLLIWPGTPDEERQEKRMAS